MKKTVCFLLTALLVLTLAGCRADLVEIVFHGESFALSREDAITAADIFDKSEWTEDAVDCPCDYSLLTDRGPMEYNAAEGILNNTETERSYRVSEADREILNGIFARYAAENG